MRDRLIELIRQAKKQTKNANCDIERNMIFADYLLANGVVALPCKVGDVVYFVIEDDVTEEGKYISKQQINDVSTKGIFVSDSLSEENCECFVPYSDFGKSAFYTEEEAERALKGGEPICDYTKTDWNDCCECAAKDYCDKYNERSEIIGELLGEIKNEGR